MAGSGKTTFLQRLNAHLHAQKQPGYIINLDPAVTHVPYGANVDIRDTVNYKNVRGRGVWCNARAACAGSLTRVADVGQHAAVGLELLAAGAGAGKHLHLLLPNMKQTRTAVAAAAAADLRCAPACHPCLLQVMKQYSLGPNGGILTSLNLFATRFDQAS